MNIQTKLRAQDVSRWNIVHTVRKQSLAEHSFNVAQIALHYLKVSGKHLDVDPGDVLYYALHHDLDEIITGDIPAPTKRRAKERGIDLNELVTESDHHSRTYPPAVKDIVKIADMIENIWFIRTYGHGRHAREVADRLYHEISTLNRDDMWFALQVLGQLEKGDVSI